ncbi:hypothetical protein BaRGS_00025239 [Batillaria attramentaria]|uniref:Transmembrane protein 179 n=1 Tax=Batillaria attramentaria TaxID=370345 RepID=A0ABD0K8Y6_9CAEN
MGLGNILLLAQVTICLILFILSFFMFVPVSVNLDDFDGHCLLYATGKWKAEGGEIDLDVINWGSTSPCNFAVFTGVVVMLTSLFYVVWYSILLFKAVDSSWLDAFISAGLSFLLMIFSFASALNISVGFRDWCSLVTAPKGNIVSCEDGDIVPFGKKFGIDTRHFYTEFEMAQFGAWSVWIFQLSMFVLTIIKLYRYHRQEAFLTSMTRERQRLLQRVQGQSYQDPVST